MGGFLGDYFICLVGVFFVYLFYFGVFFFFCGELCLGYFLICIGGVCLPYSIINIHIFKKKKVGNVTLVNNTVRDFLGLFAFVVHILRELSESCCCSSSCSAVQGSERLALFAVWQSCWRSTACRSQFPL